MFSFTVLYVNWRFQHFFALHSAMAACHGLAMELAPPAKLGMEIPVLSRAHRFTVYEYEWLPES
jgi:hypothetical protein